MSARKGKMRCMRCFNELWLRYDVNYGKWNNIELLEVLPDTGFSGPRGRFRCRRCQHTYISNSAAARRMIRAEQRS